MMPLFKIKAFRAPVMLGLVVLLLAGCGRKWPEWATIEGDPFSFLSDEDKALAPPPPGSQTPNAGQGGNVASSDMSAPVDPLDAAGSIELEPGAPLGSFGLNMDTYLDPRVLDVSERVTRLERVVAAMHRDMKVIAPAVQDLEARDGELVVRSAPGEPVRLNDMVPPSGAVQSASPKSSLPQAPAATGPQDSIRQGAQPATLNASGPVVTGIRVGQHSDKVRLVFDVTTKTNFNVDLDNEEKLLVVELPDAQWGVPVMQESFGKEAVVRSYKVDALSNGSGHVFVMQLKQTTQILEQMSIPALSGGGQRLVIDLKK